MTRVFAARSPMRSLSAFFLGAVTSTAVASSTCTALRVGTADFDQVRAEGMGVIGLPGDGGSYCYPTTWTSWMAYLNQNGFPAAMSLAGPVSDWTDPAWYDWTTLRIASMGVFCDTRTPGGTVAGFGVLDYLDAVGLGDQFTMSLRVVDYGNPSELVTPHISPYDLWYHLQRNDLVSITIAWALWEEGVHVGSGSHAVGVTGTLGSCEDPVVLLRNPGSGGSAFTQSPFVAQETTMSLHIGEHQRAAYDVVTKAIWELSDYSPHRALLHTIRVLSPVCAYAIPDTLDGLIFYIPFPIGGGEPETTFIALPDGATPLRVVPHVTGRGAIVAIELAGEIQISWDVDGECVTLVPDLLRPLFAVDRFGEIFTVRSDLSLVRARTEWDEFGSFEPVIAREVETPDAFRAMAYNDASDMLYGIGADEPLIYMFDRDLVERGRFEMPGPIPIGEEVSFLFSPDGTRMWIASDADPRVFEFSVAENGAPDIVAGHLFEGVPDPTSVQMTDAGRLLVMNDSVHEYSYDEDEAAWVETDHTGFAGLTGLHSIAVARSRTNSPRFEDPEQDPAYPETLPEETLPLCPADLDDDGVVAFSDLLITLGGWGDCELHCPGDANDNGVVNFEDIIAIISAWGPCPE